MSNNFLCVGRINEGTFYNIEMKNEPHLKLVQFIEPPIKGSESNLIITHHPIYTNNDFVADNGLSRGFTIISMQT